MFTWHVHEPAFVILTGTDRGSMRPIGRGLGGSGSVCEIGDATQKFFRVEMEKSWGEKHLCVFSEEEAKKWVLGVCMSSTSWSLSKAVRFGSASWSTLTLMYSTDFFQAVCLLSANLEAKANSLHREALQCITVALAGSNTKKFWSLMTAYFSTAQKEDGDGDPWDFLDALPAILEPLPLMETDAEDETVSVKSAPAAAASVTTKPTGAAKRKPQISQQKDLLQDLVVQRKQCACTLPVLVP